MDVEINITDIFDTEFQRLPKDLRKQVSYKINELISDIRNEQCNKLYRLKGVAFPNDFDRKKSTLYIYRATPQFRIILTLDTDAIFSQKILTLFRIADSRYLKKTYIEVINQLYSKYGRY